MKKIFKDIIVKILTTQARWLLKRHNPIIIAVTGSVGKTSTKDAIYSVLKNSYTTRKSEKSFNSELGVPLTVLGLPNAWSNPLLWTKNIIDGFIISLFSKDYPKYLVIEAGVDRPYDMANLASWLKPTIVVLTRLPDIPVHVEYFKTPTAVIEEKLKLVEAMNSEGTIIYNHDDPIIVSNLSKFRQKAIGYSRYLDSHFVASKDQTVYYDDVPSGMSFEVNHLGEEETVKISGVIGLQNVYSALAAIAVASECDIDMSTAVKALEDFVPPSGRMNIIKGLKGTTIIDDSYNSSPIATEQALTALGELKYTKRKIAVLGDMLDLGQYSAKEHERIGGLVPRSADVLLTVGVRARAIAESALSGGLSDKTVYQYDDVLRAGKELQAMLKPGDVILVKASQGIRAEKIVEEIMQEPDRAKELLVRQDNAWQRR